MSDESETTADISTHLISFVAAGTAAASRLAAETGFPLEYSHVQEALERVLSVGRSEHLLREGMKEDRIVEVLRGYPFAEMFPEVLDEVVLDEPIIPPGALRRLEERTVKAAGEVWRVHKNDADPFPSNPHAHNLESGLKLHLGTGELFLKRVPSGKIHEKDLRAIRAKLAGMKLPTLAV